MGATAAASPAAVPGCSGRGSGRGSALPSAAHLRTRPPRRPLAPGAASPAAARAERHGGGAGRAEPRGGRSARRGAADGDACGEGAGRLSGRGEERGCGAGSEVSGWAAAPSSSPPSAALVPFKVGEGVRCGRLSRSLRRGSAVVWVTPVLVSPLAQMLKVVALVCVCVAAWCSPALAAAAGGRPDSGNFLDDKQWLTTISQYDKEVGQWNKFRDDDYFRTWSPGKPFDQALDPAKDPCLKMKCSRHKVCVAQDQQTAVCISHRRLTHSMKEAGLGHKQWRGGPISSDCKQCPVVYTNLVCGSDGHTYSSQCKLDYQACVLGKQISVKCEGRCPCPPDKSTNAGRNDRRVCSDLEFREVANRLRDWFKALHESGVQNKKTRIVQRPERTRFDTSILPICKDSLGWMFNRLDTNYDLLLDQSELGSIYLDKNEPCTRAFFNSCDTYKDSLISNNEWCYCFQRQQDPPCQTELSNIRKQKGGKKLLGQYIPLCDEDGYYKPSQCHGSVGQCWCVDRYGNELTGSRTNGVAECAIDLETSGDFASGDFHGWTDDEDDEDEIMNDEDEIEDDDEDEGDDDVDDDDDHDGYI